MEEVLGVSGVALLFGFIEGVTNASTLIKLTVIITKKNKKLNTKYGQGMKYTGVNNMMSSTQ